MESKFDSFTVELDLNPPANKEKIKEVEAQLGVLFPEDYIDFISSSNGAEGSVGEAYLALWSIDEIIELNEGYAVDEFAKGLVLFGSDGGDTAYAFDGRTKDMQIVSVPFIGMDLSEISVCSKTFYGFLEYLSKEG